MTGLAYWPLLLWLPLLAVQGLTSMYMGRGAQAAVRSIVGILVDTPLGYVLKIVWLVMCVLALDCMRGALSSSGTPTTGQQDNSKAWEVAAAKEGLLVLAINLAAMPAIFVIHTLNAECAKLERDRDIMKKQATQQGDFAKQLLSDADTKKSPKSAGPPPTDTKPPEAPDKQPYNLPDKQPYNLPEKPAADASQAPYNLPAKVDPYTMPAADAAAAEPVIRSAADYKLPDDQDSELRNRGANKASASEEQ